MSQQGFVYFAPEKLEDVCSLLREHASDAFIIGGGTAIVPRITAGTERRRVAIGLEKTDLRFVRKEGNRLVLGALATYRDLLDSKEVARDLGLLKIMADGVTGGASITNWGTVAGSASFANPASDVPACLLLLDAQFKLVSYQNQVRVVPAAQFFIGPFITARRDDELLAEIAIPIPEHSRAYGYHKIKFCTSSWPIVTAACAIGGSTGNEMRFAVGAAAGKPVLVSSRRRSDLDMSHDLSDVVSLIRNAIQEGWSDELADGPYRLAVFPVAVRRAFESALVNGEGA
jgi:aerobic carbon-monoxide dehydrogenase medium subunit